MAKETEKDKKQERTVSPKQLKGRRFGRVLTKLGRVTREQVHESLAVQRVAKKKGDLRKLGQFMVEMGLIQETDILQALAGCRFLG